MSHAIQDAAAQGASLTNLCQMAGISRTCYYRGLNAKLSAATDALLRQQVQQVALDWSCYGYRRVTQELKRQGIAANYKRVLRLMREENLVRRSKKRFVATTNSDHWLPVYPNLAAEMDITAPDQHWVSDLTYIRLGHEFIYLAVVLDACSRRCLGWSLGRRLDSALATSALKMALRERKPEVHRSDRGVQYASGEYTTLLKESGIQISMSRSVTFWKPFTTRSDCIRAWATCRPPSTNNFARRTETRTRPSHLNYLSHPKGSVHDAPCFSMKSFTMSSTTPK